MPQTISKLEKLKTPLTCIAKFPDEENVLTKCDDVLIECKTENNICPNVKESNLIIHKFEPEKISCSTTTQTYSPMSHLETDAHSLLRMIVRKVDKTNQVLLFMLITTTLSLCFKFYEIIDEKIRYDMMTSKKSFGN